MMAHASTLPATQELQPFLVSTSKNRVLTMRFNDPKKKNAWGDAILTLLLEELRQAAKDEKIGAVILTGSGDYYCRYASLC